MIADYENEMQNVFYNVKRNFLHHKIYLEHVPSTGKPLPSTYFFSLSIFHYAVVKGNLGVRCCSSSLLIPAVPVLLWRCLKVPCCGVVL